MELSDTETIIYAIDSKLIIANEEHRNLYDKMMRLTGASSTWNVFEKFALFMDCQLTIDVNGLLVYYINRISGNVGNEDFNPNGKTISPFVIEVRDQELVVIEGELDTLEKVCNTIARVRLIKKQNKEYKKDYPLIYKKSDSPYVAEQVNRWAMLGCPSISVEVRPTECDFAFLGSIGVSYGIFISDNELYITSISSDEVKLNLTGIVKKQLRVTDKKTDEEWSFTNTPDYAFAKKPFTKYLVNASCVYTPPPIISKSKYSNRIEIQCSEIITPELQNRADALIRIILDKLSSI